MIDATLEKLENGSWTAAVVGLGYVGLPLAVVLARAGMTTIGYDVDPSVVKALAAGGSHVDDVPDDVLAEIAPRARFTSRVEDLRDADVVFICVPTPLEVGKQPDISFIRRAAESLAAVLRPGQLVILESTTYPGTTENVVRPILEQFGLCLDDDFLLAYSPERLDPGNALFHTANIPRIVGGASELSARAAERVYSKIVNKVIVVSNARTAEMAKLLENTFRWVNIALANEMTFVARAIDVNIWEVIDAAATKPFGFMPFYPGPGPGGHCIPIDPFYLQWAARVTGEGTRFIELAEWINARMPQVVVERVRAALNEERKALNGSHVFVLGVAYKPNVRDYRESPAIEVIRHLRREGSTVSYADPHVPKLHERDVEIDAIEPTGERLADADCVLILTDHDGFPYETVLERARLIVDTRNALGRRGLRADRVRLL